MGGLRVWACGTLLTLVLAQSADAQELTLDAHRDGTGYIALTVTGPQGQTATLTDGGRPLGQIALTGTSQTIRRAAQWRCAPRHRTFTVQAGSLTATAGLTTPKCAKRFTLTVRPRQPRAGRPLTILLVDRWKLGGVSSRACARGPEHRGRCRTLRLHGKRAAWRFRPGRAGIWRIGVRTPSAPTRRDIAHVRPANGRLTLLATGDSMIQLVDNFLQQRLQSDRVGVFSDARISTGLSKPALLDWPQHAKAQARQRKPDVTVMFIGANEGFPIHSARCCGAAWIRAYADRASGMMHSYARHGAGSVYWALVPTPRDARLRRVLRAVNQALRDAARRHPGEVHLVHLPRRFTPGGQFRQYIRWHGRSVSVRQPDGVHLNVAGASIAATLIAQAMRRDGVI